jgi:hypothetical protein
LFFLVAEEMVVTKNTFIPTEAELTVEEVSSVFACNF